MLLEFGPHLGVVLDLDDTLYKERDYMVSGFRAALRSIDRDTAEALSLMLSWQNDGLPVMNKLAEYFELSYDDAAARLLDIYRFHTPDISLSTETQRFLDEVRATGAPLAVITDGRSRTQRAKLAALGLADVIPAVVVSEELGTHKPHPDNYLAAASMLNDCAAYVYIADNPRKDFIAPNRLGWQTVQLNDDGRNVHSQRVEVPADHEAQIAVDVLSELLSG